MGILVQVVIAVLLGIGGLLPAVVLLHRLGAGADAVIYGPVLSFAVAGVAAHKLYWRHVRKRAYLKRF